MTANLQMSKKALMERAKEDRKKSDTGEKAKNKPKVNLCVVGQACTCYPACCLTYDLECLGGTQVGKR